MTYYDFNGTQSAPIVNGEFAKGAEVTGTDNYATFSEGTLSRDKYDDAYITVDGETHNLSELARAYNGQIRIRIPSTTTIISRAYPLVIDAVIQN